MMQGKQAALDIALLASALGIDTRCFQWKRMGLASESSSAVPVAV